MPSEVLSEGSDPSDRTPLDALRRLHDERWDEDRGMDRMAPGVAPDVDLAALGLHAVRETALGAFLDLTDGRHERAAAALRQVLALQYDVSDRPWSGTFPVAAEQPQPGDDAVEWVDYDPNWRQFVGCTLAMCRLVGERVLPHDVLAAIATALDRCVAGEPEDRIARWYTNPNLMHAWLQGHVGVTSGDDRLLGRAHERLAMLVDRFRRHGDLDEYNSPTYDGIDLWAIGLWAVHPPGPAFADAAAELLPAVGARISMLYHPAFGTSCGPYLRAYGLAPTRYVSLSGLLFAAAGEHPRHVLPPALDANTVHVHDLYFAPAIAHVAAALTPHLRLRPVDAERHHEQRFTSSVAESLLRPDLAIGWERGRRHEASLSQYVPFSCHTRLDGRTAAVGVMVPSPTAWIDVHRSGDLEFRLDAAGRTDEVGVRIVLDAPVDDAATMTDRSTGSVSVRAGRCLLEFPAADAVTPIATAIGSEIRLRWSGDRIEGRITVG
jgi:hypothetical protein